MPAKKKEDDLDTAARVLSRELRDDAEKLSAALFPQGLGKHQELKKQEELDLIRRHWNDKTFRMTLLERIAPPDRDGNPDPVLVDEYFRLYREAILQAPPEDLNAAPGPQQTAAPEQPMGGAEIVPPPMLPTLPQTEQALSGATPSPAQVTPPLAAPPAALPGAGEVPGVAPVNPGAVPAAGLPTNPAAGLNLPPGAAPPPPFPEGL